MKLNVKANRFYWMKLFNSNPIHKFEKSASKLNIKITIEVLSSKAINILYF